MELAAIFVSAIGHACWDYELTWMASKDPDASIIHMHWLRLVFMVFFFQPLTWRQQSPNKSWYWWIKFALVGWVIPSLMYTLSVLWTGYRISVSFQSFIPLLVVLKTRSVLCEYKSTALILTMCGTLCIWSSISFQAELYIVWTSLGASLLQILCLSEFFIMLKDVEQDKTRAITTGLTIGVVIMLFLMILWTPQHLVSITSARLDKWLFVLLISAVASGIKLWLIAYFSDKMTPDGVAIFECVHPIATLASDIVRGKDFFEYEDLAAIICFTIGWILYPKMNI